MAKEIKKVNCTKCTFSIKCNDSLHCATKIKENGVFTDYSMIKMLECECNYFRERKEK